jgi:hypothetical protein
MNILETYDYFVRARRDLWARLESVLWHAMQATALRVVIPTACP